MTVEQIEQLTSNKDGKVCARFYQRSDGTVLLENCPVGAERFFRRVKVTVCSAIAFFVFAIGVCVAGFRVNARTDTYDRIEAVWNDTVWTIQSWFGMKPPMLVMGEPCVLSPAPVPSTNQTSVTSD